MSNHDNLLSELDRMWERCLTRRVHLLSGTPLWHAGSIGPEKPVVNAVLFLSKNRERQAAHDERAIANSQQDGLVSYRTEFRLVRELELAFFNRLNLSSLVSRYCDSDLELMKQILADWLALNSLDGMISFNGDLDEVLIVRPEADLRIHEHVALEHSFVGSD